MQATPFDCVKAKSLAALSAQMSAIGGVAAQRALRDELLSKAIAEDWPEGVEALLPMEGAGARGESESAALRLAAKIGNLRIAELLIPFCDAGRADAHGGTAAKIAILGGHKDFARRMLPLTPAGQRTANGMSLLMWAAVGGDAEMIAIVLDGRSEAERFELAQESSMSGITALMQAAVNGNVDALRALAPISDYSRKTPRGDTALRLAAQGGKEECALFLAAANPEALAEGLEEGNSVIDCAATVELADQLALLLSARCRKIVLDRYAGTEVELPQTRAAHEREELSGVLREAEEKKGPGLEKSSAVEKASLRI